MKNKQFKNLIQDLQSVRMTKDEKADVLQRVFDVVEVSSFNADTSVQKVKSSFYDVWYGYLSRHSFAKVAILLFVLLGTGGVSMASEASLPGDFLYKVKVGINEPAKSIFAITPEAKAKFALEITDKRLREAALLSQKGRFTDEAGNILERQLNKQVDQVRFQVASLVSTNNLRSAQEIALNFESSLRVHELILEQISGDRSDISMAHFSTISSTSSSSTDMAIASERPNPKLSKLESFISTIKTELATTSVARKDIQSKEIASLSSNNDGRKVELRISQVKSKISEVSIMASSTTVSTSTASTSRFFISESVRLIGFANDLLSKAMYSEAIRLTQSAFQYINDAEVLLLAEISSDSDIRDVTSHAFSSTGISLTPLSTTSSEIIMNLSVSMGSSTATSTADNAGNASATSSDSVSSTSTSTSAQ
jgi:hypothetical protein